jgi:hypothetical protein
VGVRVQISARLISWPQQCACCLGRATEVYQTSHTRVTGKKVIRTDSRSWKVPYCGNCLDHVDAEAEAKSINSAGAYTVLVLGIVFGLVVVLFGSCCCGPALFTPSQPAGGNREPATVGLVIAMGGSTMVGIGLVVGAYLWYRQLEANARRRRRRAMQHAESLASRDCCTLGPAVAYEGWYGSVHTFWFAHADYAEAFIRANPGKVLRG